MTEQIGTINVASNINNFGIDPFFDHLYLASRVWLVWLQGLFKNMPNLPYKWHPEINETQIVITEEQPNDLTVIRNRPLIVTSRDNAQWLGTGMNQVVDMNMLTGDKTYTDIISTNITIKCIAKEGVEATRLAYIVSTMLPVFRENIIRLGRLHDISTRVLITKESKNDLVPGSTAPEWRMVQVVVPFTIQEQISTTSDFVMLAKNINQHMELEQQNLFG